MMSLLNAWLLKRFKRRPLVMVSSLGMAACMFVSGTFTKWIKEGKSIHLASTSMYYSESPLISRSICPFRIDRSKLGASCVFVVVRVLVYDWPVDHSMDHDCRAFPNRNPWHCPFYFVFNGQFADVCSHPKLQVKYCRPPKIARLTNTRFFYVCSPQRIVVLPWRRLCYPVVLCFRIHRWILLCTVVPARDARQKIE